MAELIVFVGPSLRDLSPWRHRGMTFRAPAKCGDVLQAAIRRPAAIGLIDGYLETAPAPWHKELLFALSQGIAIFGAASIGALRAAEMAPFGMVGIGRIYEQYRRGALEADDEVAVLHGPAEAGYPVLTQPLVNIRATLELARASGALADQDAATILAAARALFYKDRTWPVILAAAAAAGFAHAQCGDWLRENCVDQKALDAAAMIEAMIAASARRGASPPPTFVPTRHFVALEARIGRKPLSRNPL
jgi:hypothetical protein